MVPQELDGAVVSNEYSTLRTRPELLMDFFQHYAHTPYFQRTCFHSSHGVDVEKMIFKLDEWLAREFDLPPAVEQKKIAGILASVDEAIKATQAVIDQLEVVKKALMAELLIRGLPGKHRRFKQTEIGEIPEEWRCEGIGQLAALGSGTTPSRTRPEYFSKTDGTAWVKTLDLNDHLVTTTQEFVSEVGLRETSLRVYPVGTVVVAMYGGFGQIGRSGILGVPAATNQALCPILPRPDVLPLFLNHVLVGFRDRWRNIAASSRKDPNITKSDVGNFAVPVPPLDEQREIVAVAEAHVTRLSVEGECLTALRQVRAALMSVLLSGEVRVKPDPEPQ
ncbi:MAG: restriction endonuclease subunit S [Polyangiaceae bacterium]